MKSKRKTKRKTGLAHRLGAHLLANGWVVPPICPEDPELKVCFYFPKDAELFMQMVKKAIGGKKSQ